ncbi:ABC transporter permease subunit [Paenibacillus sp. LMG 31461]|uniref:ABC transporter permease subunit n=1 Tax=Paenibacillus plantarum TaxID=2654975 RepID=A0ABX1X806_9BACL|nr:sugar ABC transporter permease [Paenibacillus plantarum]NOU64567.1 ABC transporter permease subunit [Paenibacillus plantarum]
MLKNKLVPYSFLLPALLGLAIFKLYPLAIGFTDSFYQTIFMTGQKSFIGFGNYISLFKDPIFWKSIQVTLWMNLLINPIQIALSFALAIFLNKKVKGIAIFRTIQIVPIAVSIPIACIMFNIIMNPEQGVLNSMLVWMSLDPQPFLTSSGQAMWVIILLATWKGVGYWMLFLLAGLQEVPDSLYEASSIDGASKWTQFRNVTFPMMKRPLVFVTVSTTVANFLLFAPMYILTNGGPQNSTNVLMLEAYNSAFVYSDMGRASAIIIVLLLIILLIISAQFMLLRAKH